jgi:hypothetical protein
VPFHKDQLPVREQREPVGWFDWLDQYEVRHDSRTERIPVDRLTWPE